MCGRPVLFLKPLFARSVNLWHCCRMQRRQAAYPIPCHYKYLRSTVVFVVYTRYFSLFDVQTGSHYWKRITSCWVVSWARLQLRQVRRACSEARQEFSTLFYSFVISYANLLTNSTSVNHPSVLFIFFFRSFTPLYLFHVNHRDFFLSRSSHFHFPSTACAARWYSNE